MRTETELKRAVINSGLCGIYDWRDYLPEFDKFSKLVENEYKINYDNDLANYIATYIKEDKRQPTDKWVILDAINAFSGGAR